ncbi:MAG: thioredoxin family protein [Planctomycetota bacterium]
MERKGYRIQTINLQTQREQAEQLGVSRVPTFIFFHQGEEIRRRSGDLSTDEIEYMFRPADAFF